MGLFDLFTGEFVEVIDWVQKDPNTILWKFPDKDANIKNGAQLTVRESQTALLLDEGQMADVFEPGRYELITDNIPLLTSLRNWDKNFNSPFKCDVYFLSTKTFTGLKWGTPNPIIMRDPQFKQVRVKAFGTYFIKIADPKKFFTEFAGTGQSIQVAQVENSLRDLIAPSFAEALSELGVSVLDMASNYTELSEQVAPILQKDLDAFGVELVRFQVTSTSLPKEVEEFYDKMTNMNMVDDMSKFTQFQQANALEKAAENPSGGAGEGIGMGMGFGMAQMMANQQMNTQPAAPKPAASTDAGAAKTETKAEIMATLKELGALKEAGILDDKEFAAKKKELLARL